MWGNEGPLSEVNAFESAFSVTDGAQIVHGITPQLNRPNATIATFIQVNGLNPLDVLGVIGHATTAAIPNTQPPMAIATGLEFVDDALVRTPDGTASGNILGVCYDLDQTQPNAPCESGFVAIPSYDGTQVGCYYLTQPNGQIAQTTRVLLTSAKIVFVGACDTGETFTGAGGI